LMLRYSENEFDLHSPPTIGIDLRRKTVQMNGKQVRISFMDTSGGKGLGTVNSCYYRFNHGFVFIYSIDDESSFQGVKSWIESVKSVVGENFKGILVANKCDIPELERMVPREEGQQLASEHGMKFTETSARSGENVSAAFETLVRDVIG